MCYMNGDNNLTDEVLHAVDMMETVGSSKHLTILALVDGRRNSSRDMERIGKRPVALHYPRRPNRRYKLSGINGNWGIHLIGVTPISCVSLVCDLWRFGSSSYTLSARSLLHSAEAEKIICHGELMSAD